MPGSSRCSLSGPTGGGRREGRRRLLTAAAVVVLLFAVAACGTSRPTVPAAAMASSAGTPSGAQVVSCGQAVTLAGGAPRVVTVNQAATEIMLSLGLAQHLVGTAYLDDDILPELASAYDGVPVLSPEYPSREALLATRPTLVYASYPSAFQPEVAGDRATLAAQGVQSYLSPAACPSRSRSEPLRLDDVWEEIHQVGTLFGVPARAETLVDEQRRAVDGARATTVPDDLDVLWWDSGSDVLTVGACCGAPGMILEAAGLANAFPRLTGGWAEVGWESVAAADPDLVVLVDADWHTAAAKRAVLERHPLGRSLRAVREGAVVVVPFSATTPGVRNAAAVVELVNSVARVVR
ncbi:MAG TPA: ABC transporter substrate-binding protein [Actinomycetales bacterium]|nr:ABC transporter substrate-binding protein [Actinomycetales bacterium]